MKLPNGFGSVYKLSGKRRKPYVAYKTIGWDNEGKQLRKIIGYFQTKQEAIQKLSEFNNNPYDLTVNSITFEKLFNDWFAKKENEICKTNATSYKTVFKIFEPIYNKTINEIKSTELQRIFDNSGKEVPTLKKAKTLLNQMYAYAIKNDITNINRSQYIKIEQKYKAKIIHRNYEDEEIQKLWDNVNMKYVDTILICIYTGMRPSELLDIKIDNVHINERYMIGGIKTEAGINRIIPLHKKIVPLIQKRYDYAKSVNGTYLILNLQNHQMKYSNYKREKFDVIMENLQMNHLPHDGRHTCATLLDRANANRLSIKKILGHSSQDITEKVYTHKDINDLLNAIDLI